MKLQQPLLRKFGHSAEMNMLLEKTYLAQSCAAAPQTAAPVNGAQALIATLLSLGVDTVFGYPGGAVLPLYDALHAEPRLRHVLVRHEQAAVHAAEGYARSTGRVGVVFVTSGPGMSNTTTGLLDALCDSIPVLCISGQVATGSIGTDAFQECDALGISKPVTKWNVQIRAAAEVAAVVARAHACAAQGRPGPVLVDFPKDLQLAASEVLPAVKPAQELRAASPVVALKVAASAVADSELASQAPKPVCNAELLHQAITLLSQARRPVFYGGGGLINAGALACASFKRLLHLTQAPCTLTLLGLGAFPASDPQFLGMLGMHGTLEANLAMHEADLIICVGARFDDRVTGRLDSFCPRAKVIHLDIDARSIGKVVRTEIGLLGDCSASLLALEQLWMERDCKPADLTDWWQCIERWRAQQSLSFEDAPAGAILPQALMTRLQAAIGERDAVLSTDVGQHQMWAAQHLKIERPGRWLTSGGAGTMGYGLPAAIGAQIAHPEKLVVCVSGDASVLMNIQELSTAMQHRTPVKLVLCNNGRMGMVRQWQELIHGGRYSHSYTEALPDFVALAKAFGWQALRVERREDLDAALSQCLASEGPYFLDVVVKAEENCFPMIPAGAGHHEIWLANDRGYRPAED